MNLIRRVLALSAATAMATLVTVATSACGGATTATSAPTNGLEKKSPADVLQATAAALKAAKSVHIVGTGPDGYFDLRTQGSAATGTFAKADIHVKITIIDGDSYAKTNQAGLKAFGAPQPIRHFVGRWLKLPKQTFKDFALDRIASQLTTYYGPLEPKVRQATLNGRKVVVVSWRNGSTLHVANTGPAYPLRGEFIGRNAGRLEFSEYGVRFHITAPRNAIDLSNAS